MKRYIYVFLFIFLLFLITFNVIISCRDSGNVLYGNLIVNTLRPDNMEGYTSSYSGPSGLYSLTNTSNPIYDKIGKNETDRKKAISDISTPSPAMAPSPAQYKTTYRG